MNNSISFCSQKYNSREKFIDIDVFHTDNKLCINHSPRCGAPNGGTPGGGPCIGGAKGGPGTRPMPGGIARGGCDLEEKWFISGTRIRKFQNIWNQTLNKTDIASFNNYQKFAYMTIGWPASGGCCNGAVETGTRPGTAGTRKSWNTREWWSIMNHSKNVHIHNTDKGDLEHTFQS